MVERIHGMDEVTSSSLVASTSRQTAPGLADPEVPKPGAVGVFKGVWVMGANVVRCAAKTMWCRRAER